MNITAEKYDGEGLQYAYKNEKWMVGIKNFKPANDINNLDFIERHNQTDELFILLEGECVLLFANEIEGGLSFETLKMKKNKVYNIPRSLWHNTITIKETKLILIEDSNTSVENSEVYTLSENEIKKVKEIYNLHL